MFTWICFFVAIGATGAAVLYMPMEAWLRGYLALASPFLVQSSISLSKTLRDQVEDASDS